MQKIKLEREMKITHDCGGAFTLPDYVPAIGRMLSAECTPAPEGVYLKEAEGRGIQAELGGIATFRILYVPEESETGGIYGVTVPCDYDTAVMIGAASGPVVCRTSTTPENVICRVTAPRKLQLRCRLGTKITVAAETEPDSPEDITAGMEVKRGDAMAMAVWSAEARDLLCALDLSGLPEGAAPVSCSASVNVTECKPASQGEYRCRGDVIVHCIYHAGETVGTYHDRVPFDELVMFDGDAPGEGASARAFGRIDSAELHHDDSGSHVEVIYDLGVEAAATVPTCIIYDAYSCTSPCAVGYDDIEYLSPLCCVTGNVSVNERVPKNVTGRVCAVTAHAVMMDANSDRGRLRLSGELRGNVLISTDGELDVIPFSVPWSYELPVSSDCGGAPAVWGDVSVISAAARIDGELAIDAELSVSVTAAETRRERVVSSAVAEGEAFPARDGFTVYYPSQGETVWDIAKHFHVPTAAVACDGNVTADGAPAAVVVV